MSYRDVLKIFKLERELTDDETALLNTLRGMTDTEREMTVEAFGGTMGKVGKGAVSKQQRKIEKCDVCNYTRRAIHHNLTTHDDYHEFVPPSSSAAKKSARASSLASAIKGTASGNHSKPLLCDFSIDGKVCHGEENDGIHDKSLGYGNYHPFVSSSTAPSAVGQLSTKDNAASSRIDSEDVSVAAGG